MYDYSAGDFDSPPHQVVCKYCGEGGLEWTKLCNKWGLIDVHGGIHCCKTKDGKEDE